MSSDKKHPIGEAWQRDLDHTKSDLTRGKEALKRDLDHTKSDLTRGKEALKRDLDQTKSDLTGGTKGEDLNQHVGNTVRQATGSEPTPPDGVPNPTPPETAELPPFPTPHCPTCQVQLDHEQDVWICSAGHGQATILPVAGRAIGNIAVHELWIASETATANGRLCPFCEETMVVVDLAWDETELSSLLTPGGPITGTIRLEVCRVDRLIWSDRGDLEAMSSEIHTTTHAVPGVA